MASNIPVIPDGPCPYCGALDHRWCGWCGKCHEAAVFYPLPDDLLGPAVSECCGVEEGSPRDEPSPLILRALESAEDAPDSWLRGEGDDGPCPDCGDRTCDGYYKPGHSHGFPF